MAEKRSSETLVLLGDIETLVNSGEGLGMVLLSTRGPLLPVGLMPRMKIKGGQMERAATPYDSGSSLASSGYLDESGAILNKGAMGATMRYRGAPQDNGSGGGRWGNKENGPDPHPPDQRRARRGPDPGRGASAEKRPRKRSDTERDHGVLIQLAQG